MINQSRFVVVLAAIAGLSAVSQPLFAQVQTFNKDDSPLSLSVGADYNDNINPTLVNEISALGGFVEAKGALTSFEEGYVLRADYEASHKFYSLDEDDPAQNNSYGFSTLGVGLNSRLFLSRAWQLDFGAKYRSEDILFSEDITRARANITEEDHLSTTTFSTALIYGTDISARFFRLGITHKDETYDDRNVYSALFDSTQTAASFELGFRRSVATSFIIQLNYADDDFDVGSRDDSQLINAMAGVDWKPTGKSTLRALVGSYSRDVDAGDSQSGLSWQLSYLYQPREDTRISVISSRSSDVSDRETSSTIVSQSITVSATFQPREQWRLNVLGDFRDFEFEDTSALGDERAVKLSANVRYLMTNYHSVELGIYRQDVQSDDEFIDFEQNGVRLTWQYQF